MPLGQVFAGSLPVKYFEDPLEQNGPQPAFDLRDAAVRQRLLAQTKAPRRAAVPNLWQFGVPLYHLLRLNGGTRAVTRPEEDGTRADEVQGNEFAAFAAEACLNLHASGRLFAFESSALRSLSRNVGLALYAPSS